MDTINQTIERIRRIRDDRDWAQLHNPKDMAIAISIEASELLEHFLWKDEQAVERRVESRKGDIESEIADIGIYLVELADNLGIDLLAAMEKKITINADRYPTHLVKGSSKKYSEYSDYLETPK
jgi:NTP pyrophosphatase (non-canonical NTP hydrolase)